MLREQEDQEEDSSSDETVEKEPTAILFLGSMSI
jgi:hypothetical protein